MGEKRITQILGGCLCLIFCFGAVAFSDCPEADLSGDCVVDLADLVLFATDWLTPEVPVDAHLIARWPLDESSGETASESINGYAGSLIGDPQWMPLEGYYEGALFFDGVDDYVDIPGYKGITGTASRTCSAWIQTSSVSDEIISWGDDDSGGRWIIRVDEGGQLRVEVKGGFISGKTPLNDDQWHHIAVTLEDNGSPSISEARLYVDGHLDTISSYANEIVNTGTTQDVQIGVHSVGQRYFNGKIDEVRIYDEALRTENILRLYTMGSALHHTPDMNADEKINIEDYALVSNQWQTKAPAVVINEFLASNDADNPPIVEEGQIRDGNGDSSDWIELYNQTDFPIDLAGWGLTDDVDNLFKWQFPSNTILNAHAYLVIFASGQDDDDYPYVDPAGYLHTNFKLSASGEYLSLTRPNGTVEQAYDTVDNGFPEQEENISYGLLYGDEYYFAWPTPGTENREKFLGFADAPDFSHERGNYTASFSLTLTTDTEDATIRYTTNGTEPSLSNGYTYTNPINVDVPVDETASLCIRAATFKPGYQRSPIKTKTYLLNASTVMKGLPIFMLSGNPWYTLYNPGGIMAINGGTWGGNGWYPVDSGDYNNMIEHGMDYERPASVEFINDAIGQNFQEDCGLRVHGSAWIRPRYQAPLVTGQWSGDGKISFRLYFRGDYGNTRLEHPVLEQFPEVDSMDTVVLRAGHNDRTNPFVRDEMIRRLHHYMGHEASLGTFVNLFINGDYKGYYNLCERIDEDFCQKYYDSNLEWDVVGWVVDAIGQTYLEARDGDMTAFRAFIEYAETNDLTDPVHYANVINQLDIDEFIDYLIVQCWGGNWDWPQNNWSAAAERSPNRKWRFFVWDAEGCMDNDLYSNRVSELYYQSTDLSKLYRALWVNEDFRMLFTDRLQKHFLEPDSVMQPEFLDTLFWQLADEVKGVIPSISTFIPNTYIPGRESIFFNQCLSWGLFTFEGPRFFLNGQEVYKTDAGLENSLLSFQDTSGYYGDIYYTLDGTDPRTPVSRRLTQATLVPENAPKRVLIPTHTVNSSWRSSTTFNDTGWNDGLPVDSSKTGGVGYEVNHPGNDAYISYNVYNQMYDQYTSAYIRIPFTVDSQEMLDWNYLTLSIRYDDAFIAYINGVEVCRSGFNGTPDWNLPASSDHENNGMEVFSLNSYLSALVPGDNILAIQGFNLEDDSSDFIISPVLTAGFSGGGGMSPSAHLYTNPVPLEKSVHVKARTYYYGTWSALREADIVIGSVNENLRISELMYHPNADPNEEFIELTNIGSDAINLNNVQFTNGIDYTFGDIVLDPEDYLLLVRNQSIFENRYGTELPVVGQYEGSLENAGEKITLRDISGAIIQKLDFEDDWYDLTDGDGFSLTAADPHYEQNILPQTNLAAHWPFNEDSGTTVLDAAGSHPGTILNMSNTNRVLGHQDKALLFDGVNDYVEISGYKGITGTGSRTCALWIKTTVPNKEILSWGSNNDGGKWLILLDAEGHLRVAVNGGYILGSSVLTDGQWHHIATVLADDGSPNISETVLYVDGVPETISESLDMPVNTENEQNVQIGVCEIQESYRFFDGRMDDVRIYTRALSADEIALMANVSWSQKDLWRPSAVRGGTPGRAETPAEQLPLPGSVVINEVLSHSHAELPDWIELYNTTDQDIALGGWYLSDAFGTDADRKKYQIPAGVVLTAANPYYVIEEDSFNNSSAPGCIIPFALSEGGETLYLQSAQGSELTGYLTKEEFGAAETNVSLGRFQKSTGTWNFVPLSSQTPGEANAYPKVGPVIISEIMYNPQTADPTDDDQDYEYLELMNISDQTVRTASLVSTYTSPVDHYEEWVPWKFTDGITFEFPVNLQLAPGQRILLVEDLAAFENEYSIPGGTLVMQWTSGNLDNGGEKLQLSIPGDQEYQQDRYYIRQDRVNYDDEDDWPEQADGTGLSLTHTHPDQAGNNYTNDPANWTAADPTPGW